MVVVLLLHAQGGRCHREPTHPARPAPVAAAEFGRMAWRISSRYSLRVVVEACSSRYTHVIGEGVRFHTDTRQQTEIVVAILVLNGMRDTLNTRTLSAPVDQRRCLAGAAFATRVQQRPCLRSGHRCGAGDWCCCRGSAGRTCVGRYTPRLQRGGVCEATAGDRNPVDRFRLAPGGGSASETSGFITARTAMPAGQALLLIHRGQSAAKAFACGEHRQPET